MGAGYWVLGTGCWGLGAGFRFQVSGFRFQVAEGCWRFLSLSKDAGYRIAIGKLLVRKSDIIAGDF